MKFETINVRGVNSEEKTKCMFVCKTKGTTLSDEIKKLVNKYAKEFDRMDK